MKKAVLPAYILLVTGFLACLQKDAIITGLLRVSPCFSTTGTITVAGLAGNNGHTIWVLPARAGRGHSEQVGSFYMIPSKSFAGYCKAVVYRQAQETNQ